MLEGFGSVRFSAIMGASSVHDPPVCIGCMAPFVASLSLVPGAV